MSQNDRWPCRTCGVNEAEPSGPRIIQWGFRVVFIFEELRCRTALECVLSDVWLQTHTQESSRQYRRVEVDTPPKKFISRIGVLAVERESSVPTQSCTTVQHSKRIAWLLMRDSRSSCCRYASSPTILRRKSLGLSPEYFRKTLEKY